MRHFFFDSHYGNIIFAIKLKRPETHLRERQMMSNKSQVSGRIRAIMAQAQINQQGLADLLGMSQPAVSQYLQGRIPPPEALLSLARLGNTTIEWILTGEKRDNAQQAIAEPRPGYGTTSAFAALWEQLPREIQRDLLGLIRRIVDRLNTGDAAKNA